MLLWLFKNRKATSLHANMNSLYKFVGLNMHNWNFSILEIRMFTRITRLIAQLGISDCGPGVDWKWYKAGHSIAPYHS